jgi:hypothetical protein
MKNIAEDFISWIDEEFETIDLVTHAIFNNS